YETPLGLAPLDVEFLRRLAECEGVTHHPSVHDVEHSVQIEVPFLQSALGETPLVPIVVGQFDAAATERMAEILLRLMDDRTLIVASSDFTHYGASFGYLPFHSDIEENIRMLDLGAYTMIEEKDCRGFMKYCDETGATICGRDAIGILLSMLGPESEAHRLSYQTSGNLTGEWDHSVSYLSVAFTGNWSLPG
ncbi:MAG: AmmeMemoRadiSam system protein B, partial [Candidatus Omnitrophica bacterium]|nr:AmmeMemoRadiSam system protein B [Candidatus Omnitrophota bacterium]